LVVIYICAPDFLAQSINYVIVVGNMSLRKPTSKCSSRAPKLKEAEIGKGSSSRTVRQLDYTPRVEPVIKKTKNKSFVQPSAFGDTEASTRSKVMLPQWGDLFKRIIREEYPEYIPYSDPNIRVLDDQVFPNIRRSYLHMVTSKTLVFLYIEVMK
jgi:hypothetical protein